MPTQKNKVLQPLRFNNVKIYHNTTFVDKIIKAKSKIPGIKQKTKK